MRELVIKLCEPVVAVSYCVVKGCKLVVKCCELVVKGCEFGEQWLLHISLLL